MNFELEKARRNAIPSGQKIERYWVDERVGNPEFYTKEYTYVENGRKYGFQELKTTGYGNQWRILRKLTLKEAKGLGYYKEVKMSKFYIKEIDNYIKMTTEERRLWETRQVIQDYTYLSYDGWRNESGVLLAKLVEKLNNEKPVKIFCDKKRDTQTCIPYMISEIIVILFLVVHCLEATFDRAYPKCHHHRSHKKPAAIHQLYSQACPGK